MAVKKKSSEDVEALKNELAAVYKVNEELRSEIEALTAGGAKKNGTPPVGNMKQYTFMYEEQQYGFNYPAIMHKGQRLTPVEICTDENLQAELVQKNAGILKKL